MFRVAETVEVEEFVVIDGVGHAGQAAARHVRDVADPLSCQVVSDDVFAKQQRARPFVDFGLVLLDPSQQRGRLRRPRLLQTQRMKAAAMGGCQIAGHSRGATVERLNTQKGRAGFVQEIKPVAVTGTAHACN